MSVSANGAKPDFDYLQFVEKIDATRWFDLDGVPFTLVELQLKTSCIAEFFFQCIPDSWRPLHHRIQHKGRSIEFYIIDEDPHKPYVHGIAMQLIHKIEIAADVGAQIDSVTCNFKKGFRFQRGEEGAR